MWSRRKLYEPGNNQQMGYVEHMLKAHAVMNSCHFHLKQDVQEMFEANPASSNQENQSLGIMTMHYRVTRS